MAEIIDTGLPWFTEDEQALNAFLQTETGKRLLPKIAEQAPPLLHKGHVNAVLIRSGIVLGVQESLKQLLALSHSPPRPPEAETFYAPLEDDSKWADGQKLDPEPKPKTE